MLLAEIHHRVKNTLQLLSTMHRKQARHLTDEQARSFFEAMQDRMKSIADIHESLYKAEDLVRVNFGRYVRELATNLIRSFRPDVRLLIDVENVFLGIKTAIPCGLIINELVSNSLKYAFLDQPGEIEISVQTVEQKYYLKVRDNGVGFPEDLDIRDTDSLGLDVVISQVDKLDGDLQLIRSPGTTFIIRFEEQPDE
ncbi:MAG: sensor histidine kinase [Planctomycetaceae bacterium]|nr:sensor histidine kinase [Planctomycetaceae bacterium]